MTTYATPAVVTFAAGQLTRLLAGRTDLEAYFAGCKLLQNMIVRPQGPVESRPGWIRIGDASDQNDLQARLVPFLVAEATSYQLELGNNVMHFWRDRGRLVVPSVTADVVNGSFDTDLTGWTITVDATGTGVWNAGKLRLTSGTGFAIASQAIAITEIGTPHQIKFDLTGRYNESLDFWISTVDLGFPDVLNLPGLKRGEHAITFVPTTGTVYLQFRAIGNKDAWIDVDNVRFANRTGGDQPLTIATPWASSDLAELMWNQKINTAWFWRQSIAQRRLQRHGDLSWSLQVFDTVDGPYLPDNPDDTITLTPSATTGDAVTVTGSNGATIFVASDVGRLLRLGEFDSQENEDVYGYGVITAVTQANIATVSVRRDFQSLTATAKWALGLIGDTLGYPRAATIAQQRLWLGGVPGAPDRTEGSAIDDFPNYQPGLDDNQAISVIADGDELPELYWIFGMTRIVVGTASAEVIIDGGGIDDPITPTQNRVRAPTRIRSEPNIMPAAPEDVVLFVQKHGTSLWELMYSSGVDSAAVRDISIRAADLLIGGVKEMVWQGLPWKCVWMRTGLGRLLSMTYMREERVIGWANHDVNNGFLQSISGNPGAGQDEVYGIWRRNIAGVQRLTLEVLADRFAETVPAEDPVFLDCATTFDGRRAADLTLSGVSGSVTATASSPAFETDDIGQMIIARTFELSNDGEVVWRYYSGEITAFLGATQVTLQILGEDWPQTLWLDGFWRVTRQVLTGADFYNGQAVDVIVDGQSHPPVTVTNGEVQLEQPAAVAHIGFTYTSAVSPMIFEAGTPLGTSQGKKRRVAGGTIRVVRSHQAIQFGPNLVIASGADPRRVEDDMDTPLPLFSGDVEFTLQSTFDREGRVYIRQALGLPLTVAAIMPKYSVGD